MPKALSVCILVGPGQEHGLAACLQSLPAETPYQIFTSQPLSDPQLQPVSAASPQALFNLALAETASPWCLLLEADEALSPDTDLSQMALPTGAVGLCQVIRQDAQVQECLPRLIQTASGARFQDPLGKQVNLPASQMQAVPLRLHCAYRSPSTHQARLAALDAAPEQSAAQDLERSRLLRLLQRHPEADQALQAALSSRQVTRKIGALKIVRQAPADAQGPLPAALIAELMQQHARQTDLRAPLQQALQAQPQLQQEPVFWSLQGILAANMGQADAAREAFHRSQSCLRPELPWLPLELACLIPGLYLAEFYLEQADLLQSAQQLEALPDLFQAHPEVLALKLKYWALQADVSQVQQCLKALQSQFSALTPWQQALQTAPQQPPFTQLQTWLQLQQLKGVEHALRYLALSALLQAPESSAAELREGLNQTLTPAERAQDPWLSLWAVQAGAEPELLQPFVQGELPALWRLFLAQHFFQRDPHQAYLQLEQLLSQCPWHQSAAQLLQDLLQARWGPQLERAYCFVLPSPPSWENGGDLILRTYLEAFQASEEVLLCLPTDFAQPLVNQALRWAQQQSHLQQRAWVYCQPKGFEQRLPQQSCGLWLPRLSSEPTPPLPQQVIALQPERPQQSPIFVYQLERQPQGQQQIWLELLPASLARWMRHASQGGELPAYAPPGPSQLQLPPQAISLLQVPSAQPQLDYRSLFTDYQPLPAGPLSPAQLVQQGAQAQHDWILCLGADEWLDPLYLPWLHKWVSTLPPEIATVSLQGCWPKLTQGTHTQGRPQPPRPLCRLVRRSTLNLLQDQVFLPSPGSHAHLPDIPLLCLGEPPEAHDPLDSLCQFTAQALTPAGFVSDPVSGKLGLDV